MNYIYFIPGCKVNSIAIFSYSHNQLQWIKPALWKYLSKDTLFGDHCFCSSICYTTVCNINDSSSPKLPVSLQTLRRVFTFSNTRSRAHNDSTEFISPPKLTHHPPLSLPLFPEAWPLPQFLILPSQVEERGFKSQVRDIDQPEWSKGRWQQCHPSVTTAALAWHRSGSPYLRPLN